MKRKEELTAATRVHAIEDSFTRTNGERVSMGQDNNKEQPLGCCPEAVVFVPNETNKPEKLTREQRQRNREYREKFPLLLGVVIGSQIAVFCPFCKGVHVHGWNTTEDSRTENLLYAHCKNAEKSGGSYRVSPIRQEILRRIERVAKGRLGIRLPLTELAPASRRRAEARAAYEKARSVKQNSDKATKEETK